MKYTLTEKELKKLLCDFRDGNQWSDEAAIALAEYYFELEEASGEELEYDPIAIACDWTEYEDAFEVAKAYSHCFEVPDELEDISLEELTLNLDEYLSENSRHIKLPSGGYLVMNF
jgi:hypothetical protein